MNTSARPSAARYSRGALLLALASVLLMAPRTSAQLGSLVVTMTAPPDGATVTGTTTVTAEMTLIGMITVSQVQFNLDGANLGAADTSLPYSIPWDTKTASNGLHTLTAVARDGLGVNWTSEPVNVTVFNDLTPPTVAISSPAGGASLRGSITVSANAADNVGVTGVQFKLDGVNLGAEDTSSPYSIPWNTGTASNGPHALTAVARDAADNTTTSTTVNVTVDNSPPSVSLSSPAAGSSVAGTVTVNANASDNIAVAGVQFFLDGAPLGAEDILAPYDAAWNTTTTSNGSHTLTATARDVAGNVTTSAGGALTVDNAAPTVGISAPAAGATVRATVSVTADASDNVGVVGVRFFADGSQIGTEDTTAPYDVAWDTSAATDGTHTLTAVARDAASNSTTSAAVTVTVSNTTVTRIEETTPEITYTGYWAQGNASRPWSGGTAAIAALPGEVARATFSFTGRAISWIGFRGPFAGIANVYLDGTLMAAIDTYAATEQVRAVMFTATGLELTAHTLIVESTGTRNPASADMFVVVDAFDVTGFVPTPDSTPPTVAITWPSAGATVSSTTPVSATANDNRGVAGVRFLVDGAQIGAEDTTAPFSVSWDSRTVADGPHTLTAVARDAAGNTTTSVAVGVTVTNTAPPPAQATTRFEDTDLAITYTPGVTGPGQPPAWFHGSRSRDWSNDTSSFNRSAGARATFAFTGTSVSWIGFRAFWAGIARVYVDGVFVQELDLFLPPCTAEQRAQGCVDEDDQVGVFTADGLASGPHTLTVEVTGTRNANATDNAVVVDGFDVAPATPSTIVGTRIEETAPAVNFTGAWTQGDTTTAWSGNTAAVSATTGARATVTFTGTEVRWVGRLGPDAGIARIYLDGAFQAEFDQYFPTNVLGVNYTTTGLAPGRHTLAIEVTGTKNAASTGTAVAVDAFDVQSRFEERDAAVTYSGVWAQEHMDRPWSGTTPNAGSGTAARSATAGASAAFTFSGTAVHWISSRAPNAGLADVFLDGAFMQRVDLYAVSEVMQAAVFSATALAAGSHTLRIEVTGLRNAAATGAFVAVDAFDVALPVPAPAVTRIQQIDASVTYTTPPSTAGWGQSSANLYFSGRTVAFSTTAGSRATFTFTGSSVRWIGQRRRDAGIARVYLDGVLVGEVDTFAPIQEEFQAAMFSATGLNPGVTHTLTIEVTGTKHGGDTCTPGPGPSPPPCSSGYLVIVDAFEIF